MMMLSVVQVLAVIGAASKKDETHCGPRVNATRTADVGGAPRGVGVPIKSRKTDDLSKVVKNRFPVGEESLVKCNEWTKVKRVLQDTETGEWYPEGVNFRCNENGQWQVTNQSLNLKCVRKQSPKHEHLKKDLNYTRRDDSFHSVETPAEVQDSTEQSSKQFSETPVYAPWPESKEKPDEIPNIFSETPLYAAKWATSKEELDEIPNLEHPSNLKTAGANFFPPTGLLPQSSEHGTIPTNLRGKDNFSNAGPAIYEPLDYSFPQNLRGNNLFPNAKKTNNYVPGYQYSPVPTNNYLPFVPSYRYSPYRYSPVLTDQNLYQSLPIPMDFLNA